MYFVLLQQVREYKETKMLVIKTTRHCFWKHWLTKKENNFLFSLQVWQRNIRVSSKLKEDLRVPFWKVVVPIEVSAYQYILSGWWSWACLPFPVNVLARRLQVSEALGPQLTAQRAPSVTSYTVSNNQLTDVCALLLHLTREAEQCELDRPSPGLHIQ